MQPRSVTPTHSRTKDCNRFNLPAAFDVDSRYQQSQEASENNCSYSEEDKYEYDWRLQQVSFGPNRETIEIREEYDQQQVDLENFFINSFDSRDIDEHHTGVNEINSV